MVEIIFNRLPGRVPSARRMCTSWTWRVERENIKGICRRGVGKRVCEFGKLDSVKYLGKQHSRQQRSHVTCVHRIQSLTFL